MLPHAPLSTLASVFLLLTIQASGQTTQPGFGASRTNSAALPLHTCEGQVLGDFCCPGRILKQGSFGYANAICCVGDSAGGVDNMPFASSCTSGTPTPLTALPSTNVPSLLSLLTGTSTGPQATGIGALPTGSTSRESNRAGGAGASGSTSSSPITSTIVPSTSSSSSVVASVTAASSSTSSGGAARATAIPIAGLLLGALAMI